MGLRIAHFSHCNLGSAEASTAHVMEFADRLARRGHEVTVIVPDKGRYQKTTPCDIQYFRFWKKSGMRQPTAVISGFMTLLRLHRVKRFDCLYIRRLTLDPFPGIFSRLTGVPLVVETNGQIENHRYEVPLHFLWNVFWYPLLRFAEWILFSSAFAVTADGNKRLAKFTKRYPNHPDRFHMVLSGGIDLDRFRRIDEMTAKDTLALNHDRRYLVWVGTIFAWSGLEILIDAAQTIFDKYPDVDILIIGEGSNRPKFMEMVQQKGLSERIKFTGYIATAELYTWLSASDLALAPYTRLRLDREDFTSYKIFEYLACGLPVVCSYEKGDSNISYVSKYQLGATVPPEDAQAFAQAVLSVLSQPRFFGPDFVTQTRTLLESLHLTWDGVVDQVEQLCCDAVHAKRGKHRADSSVKGAQSINEAK